MMRFKTIIAIFFFIICPSLSQGQDDIVKQDVPIKDILPQWKYIQSGAQSLYEYLADQALLRLEEREQQINALKSEKNWLDRQQQIKKAYAEILGAFPEKTALNAVTTATVKNDGVEVRKIVFESIPGYYVTGALFLPEVRKGKLPAILYCSGHSQTGFRGSYQRAILNLVKKGFAVFAFDPIGQGERRQYAADSTRKKFGPTQEHSYPGSQLFLAGRSPAYYFIWDGIRAIDFLCSQSEIDTTRIGITGRSGGGTQTAYIAALDDRIKAAAPECYISSYRYLLQSMGPQDAEQNFLGGIAAGLDISDLLIAFAPKPLLIVTTSRDIFSIQGARDAFEETKTAYTFLNKPHLVNLLEDDAAHASTLKNREATYQFFQESLRNPGNAKEEEVQFFKPEDLKVTASGNVYQSLGGENLSSLARKYAIQLQNERQALTDRKELKQRISQVTGFNKAQYPASTIFCGRYQRVNSTVEAYLLKSSTGYYIPLYVLSPVNANKESKCVLLLDEKGKAEAIKPKGLADSLVLAGNKVVVPDLSGFGEMANGYIKGGDAYVDDIPLNLWYTGILMNQSLLGVRLKELSALINWIKKENNTIEGVATGVLTTDLLHIAMLHENDIQNLQLINPLISFQSVITNLNYRTQYILSSVAGSVKQYDLNQLINAYAEKNKLILINPRNGAGEIITGTENAAYGIVPSRFLTIRYGKEKEL